MLIGTPQVGRYSLINHDVLLALLIANITALVAVGLVYSYDFVFSRCVYHRFEVSYQIGLGTNNISFRRETNL